MMYTIDTYLLELSLMSAAPWVFFESVHIYGYQTAGAACPLNNGAVSRDITTS
jgi:hypothetical protein